MYCIYTNGNSLVSGFIKISQVFNATSKTHPAASESVIQNKEEEGKLAYTECITVNKTQQIYSMWKPRPWQFLVTRRLRLIISDCKSSANKFRFTMISFCVLDSYIPEHSLDGHDLQSATHISKTSFKIFTVYAPLAQILEFLLWQKRQC